MRVKLGIPQEFMFFKIDSDAASLHGANGRITLKGDT